MACGPPRSATCNGNRSNSPRAACTFTASRTGSPACTQSGVMRCERCASYAAITRQTPTYSFPSAAGISPIGFHRLVQRLGEAAKMPFPIRPHMLRHACGFKLANDGHDTRPCSTTSGTRTFSTRSGIPTWRPTGSRTFGGTDDGGAGSIAPHERSSRSKKTTRHTVEITSSVAVGPCVACAPSGRPRCRPPASLCSWVWENRPAGRAVPLWI